MEKKILGSSDLNISRIGIGTWAIGGSWEWGWGSQEDKESIKTIHKALEYGMNWLDTAPVYGLGHSEEVCAEAVRTSSYNPYIFTKCGLVWDSEKNVSGNLTKESIKKEVEDSLKRLKTDVIDLYQIHWPNKDYASDIAWRAMDELKKEGKVKHIALSNFSIKEMEVLHEISPITSLQSPYSLINRDLEKEILPFCLEKNIGVINYSPMGSGMLTGRMTRERAESLGDDDWRSRADDFNEPKLTENLKLVERMKPLAEKYNCSLAELSIAWTLQNPAVTGAIVGLRTPEQVDGVIKAAEVKMTEQEI